jgi:ribosomal protein S6
MTVEATKEAEAELNRKAGLDENILRHLIIKLDEE